MTAWLRAQAYPVNRKRVSRLMRQMGLETIYPKPRLSQGHPDHRLYLYLLQGVPITRVNHVGSTDMTFIRLHGGFVSLVAVMNSDQGSPFTSVDFTISSIKICQVEISFLEICEVEVRLEEVCTTEVRSL